MGFLEAASTATTSVVDNETGHATPVRLPSLKLSGRSLLSVRLFGGEGNPFGNSQGARCKRPASWTHLML